MISLKKAFETFVKSKLNGYGTSTTNTKNNPQFYIISANTPQINK